MLTVVNAEHDIVARLLFIEIAATAPAAISLVSVATKAPARMGRVRRKD